jgi:hypothetical protein
MVRISILILEEFPRLTGAFIGLKRALSGQVHKKSRQDLLILIAVLAEEEQHRDRRRLQFILKMFYDG